ncbi:MAG: hypothetical protein WDM76_19565 [Limisphaerales bacterium]
MERAGGKIICTDDLKAAAKGADLLYTDVWVSMGKESESAERLKALKDYQINQKLVKLAKADALVMHCLPHIAARKLTRKRSRKTRTQFSRSGKPAARAEGDFELGGGLKWIRPI